MTIKHAGLLLAATAGLGLPASTMAAPIGQLLASNEVYNTSGAAGSYTNASSIPVSSTDLINGLAATSTNYVGNNEAAGGSVNVLTNGSTGTGTSDPTTSTNAAFDIGTNWYAVWTLTSPSTVGSIAVTTGHKDQRVNQVYDILLSTDGTNFTSLSDGSTTASLGTAGTGFNYSPSGGNGGAAQSIVTPLSGGAFSIGGNSAIKAVEFVALDTGNDIFRELDVNLTPEPASLSLLGLGALGLLARRRRA